MCIIDSTIFTWSVFIPLIQLETSFEWDEGPFVTETGP